MSDSSSASSSPEPRSSTPSSSPSPPIDARLANPSSSHGVWLIQHDAASPSESVSSTGSSPRTAPAVSDAFPPRGPRTSLGSRTVEFSLSDAETSGDCLTVRTVRPLYLGLLAGPALTGQIDGVAGASFSLRPGESLVLAANPLLRLTLPSSATHGSSCLVLAVNPRSVVDVVAGDAEEPAVTPPASPDSPYVRFSTPHGVARLLESLAELFVSTAPYRETLIDLNAAELVVRLLQTEARPLLTGTRTSNLPRLDDDRLRAAVQYARTHLDQPLSIHDLAEQACMSESSFYRHFREEVDMTPLQFLTHERMKRARRLLTDRTQTVSTVSQEVGFQSVSYFITTFKAHVGQTPKQYQLSATAT